jgi:hypothetical protein
VSAAATAAAAEPTAVVKANKFSGFLRRPRPVGGSGTAAAAGPTLLPSTAEIPAAGVGTTEETSAGTEVDSGRFVEFVPTLPPPTTTLAPPATTRFQLEDFFGTPESVAASELSAARGDTAAFSPSARLVDAQRPPLLGSEDISENLILEEVRSRTAAITGETASKPMYTVKKRLGGFSTLPPGREYSSPGRVWLVTSRLGTGKSLTFFYSVRVCF